MRAGSIPPISSTIRSEPASSSAKLGPLERRITPETTGVSPVIRSTRGVCSDSSVTNEPPTVPAPEHPDPELTWFRAALPVPRHGGRGRRRLSGSDIPSGQVLVGLAAHDDARVTARGEDHRRARHAVVVVGHPHDRRRRWPG